jgi:hypothetical protein
VVGQRGDRVPAGDRRQDSGELAPRPEPELEHRVVAAHAQRTPGPPAGNPVGVEAVHPLEAVDGHLRAEAEDAARPAVEPALEQPHRLPVPATPLACGHGLGMVLMGAPDGVVDHRERRVGPEPADVRELETGLPGKRGRRARSDEAQESTVVGRIGDRDGPGDKRAAADAGDGEPSAGGAGGRPGNGRA